MVRGAFYCILAALVASTLAAPAASGHHCDTKVNVYGRVSLAPLAPPPYTSFTQNLCLRLFGDDAAEMHSLPPNTDQVMIRVNGDFGSSVPRLNAELDGLGFVDARFVLHRQANFAGGFTYNLPEWVALPNGPVDGELVATVTYPGNAQTSVTYHTTVTLVPPGVPEPPTPPTPPSPPTPPTVPTVPPP